MRLATGRLRMPGERRFPSLEREFDSRCPLQKVKAQVAEMVRSVGLRRSRARYTSRAGQARLGAPEADGCLRVVP